VVIERREKLHDIKSNDTSMTLFEPPSSNKVSEVNASICCRPLPDAPKLIQIKESVTYHMKLEPIADGFLNEFIHCIK